MPKTPALKITDHGTLANGDNFHNMGVEEDSDGDWTANHAYYGATDDVKGFQLLPKTGGPAQYAKLTSWVVCSFNGHWMTETEARAIWRRRDDISRVVRAGGRDHIRLAITSDGQVSNYDNSKPVGRI